MLDKLARFCAAFPVALAVIAGFTVTGIQWVLTATVLFIGGMGWETVDEAHMKAALGGYLDDGDNVFVNVPWPAYLGTLGDSVAVGSDNLYAEILKTDGPQIAVGVSGSAMVINEVMRRAAGDPAAPSPEELSFIIIGDGERGLLPALTPFFGNTMPFIDYTVQPIPVTPYDVMVVTGEYDGLADWPDRPWNLLADANAVAGSGIIEGFGSMHWDSIWANPTTVPARNVTTSVNAEGGVTTTYLVPSAELPILKPLRDHGVPTPAVDALNAVLRPIVDAGYRRNDPHPAATTAAIKTTDVTGRARPVRR